MAASSGDRRAVLPPPPPGAPARSRAAVEAHITNITTALLTLPPSHPATIAHLLTRSSLYVSLHASTSPTAADPPRAHYAHAALRDSRNLVRAAPHLPAAWLALFAAARATGRPDDAALALAEARRFCPHDPILRIVVAAVEMDELQLGVSSSEQDMHLSTLPVHFAQQSPPQQMLPTPTSTISSPRQKPHLPPSRRSHPTLPFRPQPVSIFKSTSANTLPTSVEPSPRVGNVSPVAVVGASLPNLLSPSRSPDVPMSPPKRRQPTHLLRTYPRLPPRQPRINPWLKPSPSPSPSPSPPGHSGGRSTGVAMSSPPQSSMQRISQLHSTSAQTLPSSKSTATIMKSASSSTVATNLPPDDPSAHPHYHETLAALRSADDALLLGAHDDAIATYSDVLTPRPHAPPLPAVLTERALAARSDAALRKAVYDRHPPALRNALVDARRLTVMAPLSELSWVRLTAVHMQANTPERARRAALKGLRVCERSGRLRDALEEANAAIRHAGGEPVSFSDPDPSPDVVGPPTRSVSASASVSASVTPSVTASASASVSVSVSASVSLSATISPSSSDSGSRTPSRSMSPASRSEATTPSSPTPSSSPVASPQPPQSEPCEHPHLFAESDDTDCTDPPAQRLSQLDLRRVPSSARLSAPARVDEKGQAALRDAALRDAHRKETLWMMAARKERERQRAARKSGGAVPLHPSESGEKELGEEEEEQEEEEKEEVVEFEEEEEEEEEVEEVKEEEDDEDVITAVDSQQGKRKTAGRTSNRRDGSSGVPVSSQFSTELSSLNLHTRASLDVDRNSSKLTARLPPSTSLLRPQPRSATPTVPIINHDAPASSPDHEDRMFLRPKRRSEATSPRNDAISRDDFERPTQEPKSHSSGLLARHGNTANTGGTPGYEVSASDLAPSRQDVEIGNTTGGGYPSGELDAKRPEEKSEQSKSSLGCAGASQQHLYDLLQVPRDATEAQIKKSYYILARKYHPDKNADDSQATDKFQKLAEAYRVLSDPESRAVYDRYGDRGLVKNSVDMIDPSTLFAMVFGSDQFVTLIGELQLASLATRVDDNGNTPTEDVLGNIQRARVGKLALEMIKTLKPWVDGDKKGFLSDAHRQMRKLREASFGPSLLYTVGNVYVQQTSYLLDKTRPFNLSAVMRKASLRSHKIASHHKAMSAASRVMDKQRKLHDRVMRSGRDNRYIAEDEAKHIAVEMAENAIDMMWKISVIDIETTLEDVLMIVLSGRDLVAEGEDFKLSDASFDSVQGLEKSRYRRRLGSHLGRERRERNERNRESVDRPEAGLMRPLPALSHGEGATSRQQVLSERAYGIQAMGRVFMLASR